jgi:hypothetical protein
MTRNPFSDAKRPIVVADANTAFAGSMPFVYIHVIIFAGSREKDLIRES